MCEACWGSQGRFPGAGMCARVGQRVTSSTTVIPDQARTRMWCLNVGMAATENTRVCMGWTVHACVCVCVRACVRVGGLLSTCMVDTRASSRVVFCLSRAAASRCALSLLSRPSSSCDARVCGCMSTCACPYRARESCFIQEGKRRHWRHGSAWHSCDRDSAETESPMVASR